MTAYLKIENPGVAPPEAFTVLGASMSKVGGNSATIGKFGSGNKHGVAVLLREGMEPIVFAGNLKMEFGTREQVFNDGLRNTRHDRVFVKYGGKDSNGTNRSSTEDLGFVLNYGASDWPSVSLALREFVSNSIDRAIEEGEAAFLKADFGDDLRKYRKTAQDFKRVVCEVVPENQVRAKVGHTRVFIPLTPEVLDFYNNLGKWFLHFSEPENLGKTILPKRNRNLRDRKSAVIYRRGVRVREFESSDTPSLFDYNLENLELDESRKVDDWRVQNEAGIAFVDADASVLAKVMQSHIDGSEFWEHGFSTYSMTSSYSRDVEAVSATWRKAWSAVAGEDAVVSSKDGGEFAKRKGFKVVAVPESFLAAAEKYGIRTADKVLTEDERDGIEVIEPTPDSTAAVNFAWRIVTENNMTRGKTSPSVKSFRKLMSGGSLTRGFYRDETVFINENIASAASLAAGWEVLTEELLVTGLEEVAHYVTGATDNSRDFQDFLLYLIVKMASRKGKV